MQWRIFKILFLLFLGMIVTVAVAWITAIRQGDISPEILKSLGARAAKALSTNGEHARIAIRVESKTCTWYLASEGSPESLDEAPQAETFSPWLQQQMNSDGPGDEDRVWLFEQRGWPMRALWCQYGP